MTSSKDQPGDESHLGYKLRVNNQKRYCFPEHFCCINRNMLQSGRKLKLRLIFNKTVHLTGDVLGFGESLIQPSGGEQDALCTAVLCSGCNNKSTQADTQTQRRGQKSLVFFSSSLTQQYHLLL